jgi:RHS repeat-associated protein
VAQAFDLAGITNTAGAPLLRSLQGRDMSGGCSTEPLSMSASIKNQLVGISYDAAGNVLNDGNGNTPTYDAENRIVTDAGYTYSYDADGARLEKAMGSTGIMYWLGTGGQVLTETDLTGTINEEYVYLNGARIARVDRPSGMAHLYFSNHLGSASVITDINGNIENQTDYCPYGGICYTSGSDPNRYKFTGKERDSESNLDNFGARYFTSNIGRFFTPDWADRATAVPYAIFGDPQSLNLYGYVRNNPINRADADGHQCGGETWDSKTYTLNSDTCDNNIEGLQLKVLMGALGHHGLPKALFKFLKGTNQYKWLNRKFVTGRLQGEHYFDAAHREYNDAVEKLLDLDTEEGQAEVARDVVKAGEKILNSDQPAIKDFLDKMTTADGMTGREALEKALQGDGEALGDFISGVIGTVVEGTAEIE